MKLAVILPVYNAQDYLPECLESLFAQSFTDFCLLAINDASTDNSGQILEQYAKNEPRLRVFHFQHNQGDGSATQFAFNLLNHMQAEYVARMDADDICVPDRFEKQIRYLDTHLDIDVLGGNMLSFDMTGENHLSDVPLDDADIKTNLLIGCANILNPTAMWRHQSIKPLNIQYNTLPTACDHAMWVELAISGKRFANLSDVLVHYRLHPNQASKNTSMVQQAVYTTLTRYLQVLYDELHHDECAVLARLCFEFGKVDFSIAQCQLILQAFSRIQTDKTSVLGENRQKMMHILTSKVSTINHALAQFAKQ